jgi:hypothetical protein
VPTSTRGPLDPAAPPTASPDGRDAGLAPPPRLRRWFSFPTAPTRRGMLRSCAALTAAGALAACSDEAAPGRADPLESRLRGRAAEDTATLIAAYDATLKAHPGLAGELRPLRADLTLHLKAFGGRPASPSSPASSSAPSRAPAEVPADPAAAKRALARAEQRGVDARDADLLDAPPELARLLASVAASGAGHVLLLRS